MLRVFEAFSGIGAQKMALRNINIEHEVVATSEIDPIAIKAYAYIHNKEYMKKKIEININTAREYLIKLNILCNLNKMKDAQIIELYKACKCNNNLGDITKIETKNIPEHDLFTYSFPCQDISSVGSLKGLKENSGTRSSLLWECKKIIETKKPKYLLLENVHNLVKGKNKESFYKWLEYLNELGYFNTCEVLDSKDFGIPQRRPRVFVASVYRGSRPINFIKKIKSMKSIYDIIDYKNNNQLSLYKKNVNVLINEDEYKFLDDRDWKMNGIMINDICSTQRAGRSGLKFLTKYKDKYYFRNLTDLECWRLMGFSDNDYEKLSENSFTQTNIYKLCGNSIVVNVLENIFENMFEERL